MEEKLPEKRSMFKTLGIMRDHDEEIREVSLAEFKEAVKELPTKVDGSKYHKEDLKSRIDVIAGRIKDLQLIKKSFQTSLTNYNTYLPWALKHHEVDNLQGNDYYLKLREKRSTVLRSGIEVDTSIYVELNMITPGAVKREYSVDSRAFADICKKHPEILEKYGEIKVTEFAQHYPQTKKRK